MPQVKLTINGQPYQGDIEARTLLVHFIRENSGLTGTHIGCDTTSCGACTVLINGIPAKSCTLFAVQFEGADIQTVEGLEQNDVISAIQDGFWQEHGLQCGFCTPGMMLVGTALLKENPSPTDQEIRHAISGNLCRCTGYMNIVRSIQHAASKLRGEEPAKQAAEVA